MKQLLVQYATYNIWANSEMLSVILPLTEEQQKQEIVSSFSSIYKTCFHVYDAESIWWQRLNGVQNFIRQSDNKDATMHDIAHGWQQQSALWLNWLSAANEEQISETYSYKNLKGEGFEQPLHEVLLHIFNHSTYHRGQLTTMLRQLGIQKIPATDFVHWARIKNI